MATNFSPCKGSYVSNQFPSNVMFGMNGFHVSASGAIPGHHGPLVEIALANFFSVAFREEFTRISLCLYSARSLHSLIPCLLTDQNFKNNSEKGHSRNISMRLFQNLTNSFREDFL